MKTKISLSAKDIFEFSMHHAYATVYGVAGLLVSFTAFLGVLYCIFVAGIDKAGVSNVFFLSIVALMFTVIQPLMLKLRSNKQAKKNKSIGTYLEYTFDNDGIKITDGNIEDSILWTGILKISCTKNLVLLYTTMMRAFILPKASFGENYEEFKTMVNKSAKNARGQVK